MTGAYPTPSDGPYDRLRVLIEDLQAQLRELQRPTGTSVASLVQQVQTALVNINAQVIEAVSINSMTRTAIEALVASPGAITPTSVTTTGPITTTGTGRFDGGLYSMDARNFIVVQDYAAMWIDVNGHAGISPSSRRFKRDIETWHPDVARLFEHARAVRYHDDLDQPLGFDETGVAIAGPHELGPWRYGFIAEELVDAGLEMFTFRDANGDVLGINYDRVVVALFDVLQRQQQQIEDHSRRLDALEGRAE